MKRTKRKTDIKDCEGCNLFVPGNFCAVRDLHHSSDCPCRLCPVKVMCNNRIKECPQFLKHLMVERERCNGSRI